MMRNNRVLLILMIALMPLALHAVPNLSSSGFSMYFKTGTVETIEPIHEIRFVDVVNHEEATAIPLSQGDIGTAVSVFQLQITTNTSTLRQYHFTATPFIFYADGSVTSYIPYDLRLDYGASIDHPATSVTLSLTNAPQETAVDFEYLPDDDLVVATPLTGVVTIPLQTESSIYFSGEYEAIVTVEIIST